MPLLVGHSHILSYACQHICLSCSFSTPWVDSIHMNQRRAGVHIPDSDETSLNFKVLLDGKENIIL